MKKGGHNKKASMLYNLYLSYYLSIYTFQYILACPQSAQFLKSAHVH